VTQDEHGTTNGSGRGQLPDLEPGAASAARMWNYWIGGQDSFPADRAAAEQVAAAMPALPLVARTLRRFLAATVSDLTAAGVRQFLDIGSGLPTAENTHDVAQRAAPQARIVYAFPSAGSLTPARPVSTWPARRRR
jgi:hypothetical protein